MSARYRRSQGAWAVTHWNCGLYIDTVRRTRNEAIAAFMDLYGFDHKAWDADRHAGVHKPIRVTVMEFVPVQQVKAPKVAK